MKKVLPSGMSVIEIILALSLLGLMVTFLVGGIIYAQTAGLTESQRAQALFLAEEGLEAVRAVRDENFDLLIDGSWGLTQTANHWALDKSEDVTDIFHRTIIIETYESNIKKITSRITWESRGQNITLELTSRLTHWK